MIRTGTFAALLLLMVSHPEPHLHAQSTPSAPISFGIAGGYGRGVVSGTFPVFNGSPACGVFDGGDQESIRFGPILSSPELFGKGIGLRFGLLFGNLTDRFVALPIDPQRVRDPELGTIVELEREYRHTASFRRLQLELLAAGAPGDRLRWFAGPTISWQISSSFEQYHMVVGPDNFMFDDGEVRHAMEDRYPLSSRALGFGAVAGAGYRLPISARIDAQPEVALRWTAPGGISGFDMTTLGAELRLALLYIPPPPPEPPPMLSSSLDIFCVDPNLVRSDTAHLTLSEVREETFRFLPASLSDGASDGLGDYHLLTPGQASLFTLDSVPETSDRLGSELLNILGHRLRENPEGVLILTSDRRKNRRREEVVGYLRDVWGIAEERIVGETVERSLPEQGDPGGTELTWRMIPERLNGPVRTERTVYDHGYPTIRLAPRIVAEAGVRSWSITIAQGETVLARYTDEKATRDPDGIPWEGITTGSDGRGEPLTATLRVVDSAGGRDSAVDLLPVYRTHAPQNQRRRRLLSIPISDDPDRESSVHQSIIAGIVGIEGTGPVLVSLPKNASERDLMRVVRAALEDFGILTSDIRSGESHVGDDIRVTVELPSK